MLTSFSAGVTSISTVPAKGAGRSPDSQISAGARRNRVNEWDQPVVLGHGRAPDRFAVRGGLEHAVVLMLISTH